MQEQKFRIGQMADKLNVEKFVIRFWEKEFNLKPERSQGLQRFYTHKDLARFEYIKDLLSCTILFLFAENRDSAKRTCYTQSAIE